MLLSNRSINKNVPIPLYYQLKEIILDEIKKGNLMPEDPIPTEKELSEVFEISRTTIRQAITELVKDGYLYRVKGKGTFIAKPKINQDFIKKLETFNEQIRRAGLTPSTKVLEFTVVEATEEIALALQIPMHEKVIKLCRLRFADKEPIVIVKTYLPYNLCSSVLQHDMEKESLYQVLSKNLETKIYKVSRTVEAIIAGQHESELLQIKKGYPIQFFKTIGYNQMGRPIEYSIARYRGDRNSFTVEVFV
ncbi:MAG: GntR family transcriptional regulator, N-acetylglucosamine utilization regulator [Clostridiales bacterium]|jgi:GntR family transcriptional regulator|nr:GntR family transcriptional regulator, N-acetylglucosamine utilization regulator [Clostridiales bacterium]MDK2934931.1 GntR family transcriptional regulator, N-acetylglucosamine utilization regulator [Clostridiales bacterium]